MNKYHGKQDTLSQLVRAQMSSTSSHEYDVIVIGAGFGGLGAALSLAERGYRVHLIESLRYPGGCAGTFMRGGYQFEAAATLSSGFAPGQLFERWIARYELPIEVNPLKNIVKFRSDLLQLDVGADRSELIDSLCQNRADSEQVRSFFQFQEKVSKPLWNLFEDPSLLPPFQLNSLVKHIKKIPSYLPLLKTLTRPLGTVIDQYQLRDHKGLLLYLNALCQITAQCGVDEVEAPFGLATMDYYYRGVSHVEGGLGNLAWGLCYALQTLGGKISLSTRARSLKRASGGGWEIQTRSGTLCAPKIVSNVLPSALKSLMSPDEALELPQWTHERQTSLENGWGAAMLYLVSEAPPSQVDGPAEHWQLVSDVQAPLIEGNHVFCSFSSSSEQQKAPVGSRVITLSTHVPMKHYLTLSMDEQADYIQQIQSKMRSVFDQHCPEWAEGIYFAMSASPRTFERFTGRPMGFVGGIPRTAGFKQYLQMKPKEVLKGLYLVGDTHFPGQSTLATATGGHRLAAYIDRS